MGIGPTQPAWKADALPLSYTRITVDYIILSLFCLNVNKKFKIFKFMKIIFNKVANVIYKIYNKSIVCGYGEMVDTRGSDPRKSNLMQVQILLSAPIV